MHKRVWIIGTLCWMVPSSHADAITLRDAMALAAKHHPMLNMAEQRVASARGNLTEQSAYSYNPELSLEPQRRRLRDGGRSSDYYITLSQGIELGGKRALRTRAARAGVAINRWQQQATRQQLQIAVARAFVTVRITQQQRALRLRQRDMLRTLRDAIARKLELGQSNRLQLNLAESTLATAESAVTAAQSAFARSMEAYRRALGNATAPPPDALPALAPDWQPPADAEEIALASRPDLSALRAREQQAAARSELAKANRIPDLTISAMTGREAGDRLVKLGVAVPFPLLNSHTGAFRAAEAEQRRAETELAWFKQQLRYALQSARDNHRNAMAALRRMRASDMRQTAKETIDLARKAYDAGELDLEELVVHIRQGLDTQITALDVIRQAWLARIRLAEVMGHPEYITEGVQ